MLDTLVLGFGNVDRMDDGVAWHVLTALAAAEGAGSLVTPDIGFALPDGRTECQFVLQLTPELAERLAEYRRVCFVDAHTGDLPAATQMQPLSPAFTSSPFTHHMTPATCLALAQALYGRSPEAMVASVRGEAFGFARELSPLVAARVPEVVSQIQAWLAAPRGATGV